LNLRRRTFTLEAQPAEVKLSLAGVLTKAEREALPVKITVAGWASMRQLIAGVIVTLCSQVAISAIAMNEPSNLGVINQCYHGSDQPDPCYESLTAIAGLIRGTWHAVDRVPWTIDFSPDGIVAQSGTLTISTTGPAVSGTYGILSAKPGLGPYPWIYIDMANGNHYKAGITLFGIGTLLLMDDSGTTTFHRSLW